MGANCCSETNDKPIPKKNLEFEIYYIIFNFIVNSIN